MWYRHGSPSPWTCANTFNLASGTGPLPAATPFAISARSARAASTRGALPSSVFTPMNTITVHLRLSSAAGGVWEDGEGEGISIFMFRPSQAPVRRPRSDEEIGTVLSMRRRLPNLGDRSVHRLSDAPPCGHVTHPPNQSTRNVEDRGAEVYPDCPQPRTYETTMRPAVSNRLPTTEPRPRSLVVRPGRR